ncbi:MAG TPA: nitrophenyl compound nitroreductase subunit ArsF family protein [Phycisphaerae bacterium]|nr:nitrophenyl compound nitroreductase subunit ArsF family protein [Phycisphaerae bacterium]
MKPKTIVGVVLLVFAAASLVYLVAAELSKTDEPAGAGGAPPTDLPDDAVVVTYFLSNFRCPTCLKIEAYSKEAVETGFADAVKDGRLVWRAVNTDEPGNKHFLDDYQLAAKAVVVSVRRGGKEVKWKNMEDIWFQVGVKDDFLAYIRTEVAAALGEEKGT